MWQHQKLKKKDTHTYVGSQFKNTSPFQCFLLSPLGYKKKSSVTHTKDFSEKNNAPQSPDFEDFLRSKIALCRQ
jgi:hypothetical protein